MNAARWMYQSSFPLKTCHRRAISHLYTFIFLYVFRCVSACVFGRVREKCWRAWRFVWVVVCCECSSECLSVCHCLHVRCICWEMKHMENFFSFFTAWLNHQVVSWGGVTVRPPVTGKYTEPRKPVMNRIRALRFDKGIKKNKEAVRADDSLLLKKLRVVLF